MLVAKTMPSENEIQTEKLSTKLDKLLESVMEINQRYEKHLSTFNELNQSLCEKENENLSKTTPKFNLSYELDNPPEFYHQNKPTQIYPNFTTQYLMDKITQRNGWVSDDILKEIKHPLHQKLIELPITPIIDDIIEPDMLRYTADDAIRRLQRDMKQILEEGCLNDFVIKPDEDTFEARDTKRIFIDIYERLTKIPKYYACYNFLKISFLVATIQSTGGLDYKDIKQCAILRSVAIESCIYDNIKELDLFVRRVKMVVHNFLMKGLGWERHQNLSRKNGLKELIEAFDYIKPNPMHPALKYIASANYSGKNTLEDIIRDTDSSIHRRYDRYNIDKVTWSAENNTWEDERSKLILDKMVDPLTTDEERILLGSKMMEHTKNMRHMINEYEIYQWVSNLKLAVHDNFMKPKMTEFWIDFNKELQKNPNQDFTYWIMSYMSQYTDITHKIPQGDIYTAMQSSLMSANSNPWFEGGYFKFPIEKSSKAGLSGKSSKPKQKKKKKTTSEIQDSKPPLIDDKSTHQSIKKQVSTPTPKPTSQDSPMATHNKKKPKKGKKPKIKNTISKDISSKATTQDDTPIKVRFISTNAYETIPHTKVFVNILGETIPGMKIEELEPILIQITSITAVGYNVFFAKDVVYGIASPGEWPLFDKEFWKVAEAKEDNTYTLCVGKPKSYTYMEVLEQSKNSLKV